MRRVRKHNAKRKRVLLFSAEPGRGGLARVINIQEKCLCSEGHVDLVGTLYFSRADNVKKFYHSNAPIFFLSDYFSSPSNYSAVRYLQRIIALRRITKEKEVDLLISHGEGSTWVAAFGRCTAISVIHGSMTWWRPKSWFKYSLLKLWKKICLFRMSRIVAVSDALRDEICHNFKIGRVSVIKNCVDFSRNHTEHPARTSQENLRFFALGRLAPEKNLEAAIKIVRSLKDLNIECSIVLIGDGPSRNSILELAKSLALSWEAVDPNNRDLSYYTADIVITGYVSDPEFFVKQCDILMLTSFTEGYPLAVCEALVQGKPVLAADCPTGPREIFLENNKTIKVSTPIAVQGKGYLLPIPADEQTKNIWVDVIHTYITSAGVRAQIKVDAPKMMEEFGMQRYCQLWRELLGV